MENYSYVKQIGKGSYGEVWLILNNNNRKQYVLKKIEMQYANKREQRATYVEVKLLASLKHPNIVSYFDSFQNPDGTLGILMGYCECGDLYTFIKERKGQLFEEKQIVEWFVQICMALQYLHERNILHRDLKTQNIFLTKSKIIKIGDFGISRILNSTSELATTLIGTPYYMSPELYANQPYNYKSDIWALGCCVYEMATLRHAFNARDLNSLMYKVIKGKLPPMPTSYYSVELTNLIQLLLNYDPNNRPSVKVILQNEYMRKHIMNFLQETNNCIKKTKNSFLSQKRNNLKNFMEEDLKNNICTDKIKNLIQENMFQKLHINQNNFHEKDKIIELMPASWDENSSPSKKVLKVEKESCYEYNPKLMALSCVVNNGKNIAVHSVQSTDSSDEKKYSEKIYINMSKEQDCQLASVVYDDKNNLRFTSKKDNLKDDESNFYYQTENVRDNKIFSHETDKISIPQRRREQLNPNNCILNQKYLTDIKQFRPLPFPPSQQLFKDFDEKSKFQPSSLYNNCVVSKDKNVTQQLIMPKDQTISEEISMALKPNIEARRRRREKLELKVKMDVITELKEKSEVYNDPEISKETENKEENSDLEIKEFIEILNSTLQLKNEAEHCTNSKNIILHSSSAEDISENQNIENIEPMIQLFNNS